VIPATYRAMTAKYQLPDGRRNGGRYRSRTGDPRIRVAEDSNESEKRARVQEAIFREDQERRYYQAQREMAAKIQSQQQAQAQAAFSAQLQQWQQAMWQQPEMGEPVPNMMGAAARMGNIDSMLKDAYARLEKEVYRENPFLGVLPAMGVQQARGMMPVPTLSLPPTIPLPGEVKEPTVIDPLAPRRLELAEEGKEGAEVDASSLVARKVEL